MDPFTLRVYVWMFFADLIREENVTLSDVSWKFSDNVLGTLNISDILLTGFETLTNDINNIEATEDENGNNNVCVFLPIGNLQLTLNYIADIGIDDEIPIYGDGQFILGMRDIKFNVCMFINFDEIYIDEVIAQNVYRHTPLAFTGFWRNPEVSLILEGLLNIANRFLAMWSTYEPERASCFFSPLTSYVLNIWFGNEDYTFQFDKTCLQEIFFDEEGQEEESDNIEEHILNKMLDVAGNHDEDNSLKTFLEENKSTISPIVKHLSKIAARLL